MYIYGIGVLVFAEVMTRLYKGKRIRVNKMKYRKAIILFALALILMGSDTSVLTQETILFISLNLATGLLLGVIMGHFTSVIRKDTHYYQEGGLTFTIIFTIIFIIRHLLVRYFTLFMHNPALDVSMLIFCIAGYVFARNLMVMQKIKYLSL